MSSEHRATVPALAMVAAANEVKAERLEKVQQPQPHQHSDGQCPPNGAAASTPTAAASATGKGSGKHANERKGVGVSFDDKLKVEPDHEVTELLGSVTTHNCPGTRTSARVIQKMKQDQTRPPTPPQAERDHKREEKSVQKTLSQVRANKPTWTNVERNHFFDALNDFGKDFDAVGNYINAKLKRKCTTDIAFKTKDQVRQHYYQTYHKICKYIKFSDEVKKPAQELYALINYGEMRRKLQFVTDKHFMKLKNLVYQGHITVRCKGKNIRIKTPSCKALRRLNQLDDSLEDIRLPSKIEVIVSPANMEAFGRVQVIAQNPRARTTVPLHKKLVNFIKAFQYKWRSAEMKLAEEEAKLFPPTTVSVQPGEQNGALSTPDGPHSTSSAYQDPEMCFLPKPGVTIHRPLLSITEYLSSVNICLTAYEERMGVTVRGETLCQDRPPNNKRQRTESGSDKRSPETKKQKQLSSPLHEKTELECSSDATATVKEELATVQECELAQKCESSSDELSDEINELLSDADNLSNSKEEQVVGDSIKSEPLSTITTTTTTTATAGASVPAAASTSAANNSTVQQPRSRRNANAKNTRSALIFKPLLSDEIIRRIRKGWTVSTAADITIGDLYVVLGQDSRLELDYYWTDCRTASAATGTSVPHAATNNSSEMTPTALASCHPVLFTQKQNGMPYNPGECDDPQLLKSLSSSSLGNKLKHLLLIANLSERMRKRQCSCGHTCERNAARTRIERDLAAKTYVSTKTFTGNSSGDGSTLFRQPMVPIRRPIFSMDPVKQLSALTRQKLPRQVLVQRLLLPGGVNHSYDVLDLKHFQNHITDAQRQEPLHTSATSSPPVKSTPGSQRKTNPAPIANTTEITPTSSHASGTDTTTNHSDDTLTTSAAAMTTENDCTLLAASTEATHTPDLVDSGLSTPTYQPNTDITTTTNSLDQIEADNMADFSLPGSFSDNTFDECSNASVYNGVTPMHLLRESSSNSRWLEENLNDFSLTSLLGHLDEINASGDILDPASNLSVISESSVDYMHKFQEITALMQSQDKD